MQMQARLQEEQSGLQGILHKMLSAGHESCGSQVLSPRIGTAQAQSLPGSFLSADEKLSISTTVSSQGHRSSSPDRGKKAGRSNIV